MTTPAPPEHPPPAPPAPELPTAPPTDPIFEWRRLFWFLVLAGGIYPILAIAAMVLINLPGLIRQLLGGVVDPSEVIVATLGYLPLGGLLALIVGCSYAALVCAFTLPAIALALRVTGIGPRWDGLGVFAGSLVAFIAYLPIAYTGISGIRIWSEGVVLVLLGALAILCGQVAGAYAGLLNLRDREALGVPSPTGHEPVRFSLRQIMAFTVVASAALALLRITGLLTETMMHLTVVWLVLTTLLYRPVLWFVQWRLERKLGWSRGPGWREEYRRWREERVHERNIDDRAADV